MNSAFAALRTPKDIYRYRKQRGVNLGSWFVLERWITPTPFRNAAAPGQSDLHIAQGHDARQTLEQHWGSWINDEDWKWIIDHGYNSVRIPVGYYHLCGIDASVIQNTDFAPYQNVFEGAWAFIDRAIQTAAQHHIGVLLDLHAAPGAQNPDPHSGVGNAQVKVWDGDNPNATVRALRVLAEQAAKYENVVGIELLNEPNDRDFLQGWYASTIESLRTVSSDLPIYIADGWHSEKYIPWAGARQDFVVVDHHLYRCFTEEERRKWGDQHAAELRGGTAQRFREWNKQCRGNFIVGEFSAALGGHPPNTDAGEQDRQRRVFAQAELAVFEESCGGWFFWTLKKEEGWDAGWSLKNATRAEIMPAYVGKRESGSLPDESKREQAKTDAYNRHVNYWKDKMSRNEHWRFEMGFQSGWNDGKLFLTFSGGSSLSEIGFMGEWLKRRVAEHVTAKGASDLLWEYEHGFQQGYAAILGMI